MRLNQLTKVIIVVFTAIIATGMLFSEPVFGQEKGSKAAPAAKSLPRLIDLGADKCVPCVMMAPILEEMKKEYAGVLDIVFIDVWKNPGAGQKYGIRGIPTQIFYDASGKELGRHMGFISKEQILLGFKQVGVEIKKPSGEKKK